MCRLGAFQKPSSNRWTELIRMAVLVLLLPQGTPVGVSAEVQITGVVFLDANNNGTFDEGETGLDGVAVSNQRLAVTTGPRGNDELPDQGEGVVFVVPPDDYGSASTFWRRVGTGGETGEIDFPLLESGSGPDIRFVHASDVHLRRQNLSRIRKLREIVDEQQPAFVLITGDLIQDALGVDEPEAESYHRLFLREIQAFPVLRHHRVRGAKWPSR